MNTAKPEMTGTLAAEGKLREELLNTYEEYCQLFAEIIKRLSSDTTRLRSDAPTGSLSRMSRELISRSAGKFPNGSL